MTRNRACNQSRRQFIQAAGLAGGNLLSAYGQSQNITIFVLGDASDDTPSQPAVRWAVSELQRVCRQRGLAAKVRNNLEGFSTAGYRIVVAPAGSSIAARAAGQAGVALSSRAESLALITTKFLSQPVLLLTGAGIRGLVYAILELADRIELSPNPAAVLQSAVSEIQQPANEIRSVMRLFVSDVEDKGWFYDKGFWTAYLSMLAAQRFNRFSLTLGLGYDLPRQVLDAYFVFAYPFLLDVPGYNVRVTGLAAGEPERNLEMLNWISSQTAARGLHFQLGLWSHTYQWIDSPKANYLIEGLTSQNHAAYCRDALRLLLQSCPAIGGITFRAHSESGIQDGSYDFWKTVFAGVGDCGRRVEIDLHSKGIEQRQIQMALDTGQPVRVSTKYTAEHMGLPGHQIAIRELERSQPSSTPQERSFTRYGYGDYLAEDRPYGVYFRLWPGKDKVVLWGDPAIVAGYGRSSSFCGALGLEMCEPLSFKGRQGSGLSADRRIYKNASLAPTDGDWRKYLYTYRLWGRHLYDPETNPESYSRLLQSRFGSAAAPAVELALASASKVIPLMTSAHLPSAAGMSYWPEIYSNMPVADEKQRHIYGDTPVPKVFGRVSPLDPGLFMNAFDYAEELTGAVRSGRYSPADVAQWLDDFATTAEAQLAQARAKTKDAAGAEFRRLEVDVRVQLGLGRFFAAKMRSAVAWSLYQKQQKLDSLREATYFSRVARDAWTLIVQVTRDVYVDDLTFGYPPHRRGHWADRLPSISQDVEFLERLLAERSAGEVSTVSSTWLKPRPAPPACKHSQAQSFVAGKPLEVTLYATAGKLTAVRVHYRHVNQAEAYQVEPMQPRGDTWHYTIPDQYTDTRFALQYFFKLHAGDIAWLYPGLTPNLANQPYFVVRRG